MGSLLGKPYESGQSFVCRTKTLLASSVLAARRETRRGPQHFHTSRIKDIERLDQKHPKRRVVLVLVSRRKEEGESVSALSKRLRRGLGGGLKPSNGTSSRAVTGLEQN